MAEVIAVGASVIAIIQITDRIIGMCKFYVETARDASPDLRVILLETSTLKTIFENLNFLTACNSGVSTTVSTLSGEDGPIEGCRRSVTELEKLFPSDCIQTTGQNRSKKRKVKATLAALAWPLKENKARKLLDEIMRYKTTITLALTMEPMWVIHFSYFHDFFEFPDRHIGTLPKERRIHALLFLRRDTANNPCSQDIKDIKTKALEMHDILTGINHLHLKHS